MQIQELERAVGVAPTIAKQQIQFWVNQKVLQYDNNCSCFIHIT